MEHNVSNTIHACQALKIKESAYSGLVEGRDYSFRR